MDHSPSALIRDGRLTGTPPVGGRLAPPVRRLDRRMVHGQPGRPR
jgi:hypothetical protein